jgi:hypothetical protein
MNVCTTKSHNSSKRAVGDPKTYWKNGQTIQISIIGGTFEQKEFVKFWANKWTEIVNLNFEWIDFTSGQIRITFKNEGSWSYVGTECLGVVGSTMNFGWIDEDIKNNDGSTVLHEFGHALGLHHEHQNPEGGIKWNRDAVIKALSGHPNYWTLDMIEWNVLSKLGGETQYTKFDPDSIMLYSFPKEWTLDNFQAKDNKTISTTDAEFLSKVYPKVVTPKDKRINLSNVFKKESELYILSTTVIRRLAIEFGIDVDGKTKRQLTSQLFKLI